ncbi:MAG TPA: RNA polymerase sigma-70 factor [Balneolaceae bacterium]|nr:RNA polymerase sigma-70 factor [Balneolaceae bacterium]
MNTSGNVDRTLLQGVKSGSEKAFRSVYKKYHKQLYGLALKYLRNKKRAEDAVHDVFVKMWNNKESLDPAGSLRGFLFTATKNHVLNIINQKKRALKRDIKYTYQKKMDRRRPANVINLSEYRSAYQSAVHRLPEKRREVFKLRAEEGLTSREVAEYLDISIHTVKSQYWKATKSIRAYVNEHDDGKTGS